MNELASDRFSILLAVKPTRLTTASVIVVTMMFTTAATASGSTLRAPTKLPTTESSFAALARQGAMQPLVATYKVLDAKSAPYSFVYATSAGRNALRNFPPPVDYRYEAAADGQEYEFISNNGDYYECLTPTTKFHWSCNGPVNMARVGDGGLATIGSYDVEPDYLLFFSPSATRVTRRVVNGFQSACIRFMPADQPMETWCITNRGVLAYVLGTRGFKHIELMSLSYKLPKDEFSLPAKPAKWTSFVAAKLCQLGPPGWANPGAYTC